MKVVGLDISASCTGVAIGDALSPPRCFNVSFSTGGKLGHVGAQFASWMREFLILEQPDFVGMEASFIAPTDKFHNAQLALGMNFTAQTVCHMRGVPYATVPCQTWRLQFLGAGRPKTPKQQAVRMCKLLRWDIHESEDEAEAAGVWSWAHFNHGNRREITRQLSAGSVRNFTT